MPQISSTQPPPTAAPTIINMGSASASRIVEVEERAYVCVLGDVDDDDGGGEQGLGEIKQKKEVSASGISQGHRTCSIHPF